MLQIHPNARTTPVTRAEIACSHERAGILAERYGVSTETIRKWRKRGAADVTAQPTPAADVTAQPTPLRLSH
jgi:transposase-like protein